MEFDSNYSRRILLRLVIAAIMLFIIVVISREFILGFYIRSRRTQAGLIINGAALALFLGGLVKIVMGLLYYAREEAALARFIRAIDDEQLDLMVGVDPCTIIHQRYATILRISKQNEPINHGALTSLLLADESKRLTFPRCINNILIL